MDWIYLEKSQPEDGQEVYARLANGDPVTVTCLYDRNENPELYDGEGNKVFTDRWATKETIF